MEKEQPGTLFVDQGHPVSAIRIKQVCQWFYMGPVTDTQATANWYLDGVCAEEIFCRTREYGHTAP
jgi:hypothetical protein